MRWKTNYPKDGDVRYIKKFLLLPLTINSETRWLEFVEIRQVYFKRKSINGRSHWFNTNFKL